MLSVKMHSPYFSFASFLKFIRSSLLNNIFTSFLKNHLHQFFSLIYWDNLQVFHSSLNLTMSQDSVQSGKITITPKPINCETMPHLVRMSPKIFLTQLPSPLPRNRKYSIIKIIWCSVKLQKISKFRMQWHYLLFVFSGFQPTYCDHIVLEIQISLSYIDCFRYSNA